MPGAFFPNRPDARPTIYAYAEFRPELEGLLKVGYTATRAAADRVRQQYPIVTPGERPWTLVVEQPAIRADGTTFTDRDVHRYLCDAGHDNPAGEWFRCTVADVEAAISAVRNREAYEEPRDLNFSMRPEQETAVNRTARYFKRAQRDEPDKTPHFLWNCKMRFGKTFAAYQLARKMGWQKVLVLTFKPAVEDAWGSDLQRHVDFDGWQFIGPNEARELEGHEPDFSKPTVCFGSFQDYMGRNEAGGIKAKNEWVHATNWDCVMLDEYHFGAWREGAKELFEAEGSAEAKAAEGEGLRMLDTVRGSRRDIEDLDEEIMPITAGAYLYLSGTPFRQIATGEFIEEQIFNWTYTDEQRAKRDWEGSGGPNPYAALPRMVLMTYQVPDSIAQIAKEGEFDEFDLNTFFEAKGTGHAAKFVHGEDVQKWLDLIRGAYKEAAYDDLKQGREKPPMPFADARLLPLLTHTFWFMPSVAACHAMANLLKKRHNTFYNDYDVIVAAGPTAGIGPAALPPVLEAMGDGGGPLKTKTITLSCGKLTTGVTVRPWTGILMLRNLKSPETYFQAAFRVQSPWTVNNPDGDDPNRVEIIKDECYVFDFAPNRALRLLVEYGDRLNVDESNPEKKIVELIEFLPVLASEGGGMRQLDAVAVLDKAMSGTSATLLAQRWESALLVNVDNSTLQKLISNEQAMHALMAIEGFRSLNDDLEIIINRSDSIKDAKKKANQEELTEKEKKQLTEEEKEFKSKRKEIQQKLQKFATRVPVFMYLTDFRERSLKDVIRELEPDLFKKVTGLTKGDFDLLVSLGVFNAGHMNQAVWGFKRYEDASLEYLGINKHAGEEVGLYDTTLSGDDYDAVVREPKKSANADGA